ncbi:MAG: WD40 repeat domain-containing protein [Myxococcales bacterium]|nr:WD40 repeat domain-containing protein [Myxococcales bacterium]
MPRVGAEPPVEPHTLTTRFRFSVADYVTALKVSPDGRYCALGNGSGELFLIDAASGRVLWRELAHGHGLLSLSIAPDGLHIASCGQDASAKLWNASGELCAQLPGGHSWVEQVAWSPTGDVLATASARRVRLWTAQGVPLRETDDLPSTVAGLAWHPDGSAVAAAGYGGVYICPVEDRKAIRHLRWKGSLLSVAWSPNAQVLASCSQDCSVHFWRLNTGRDSEMSGYPMKPKALAWDATSTLLATSGHSTVTIWPFRGKGPEGSKPLQLSYHAALCTQLAFHPRTTWLASGGQDSAVVVWDPGRSRIAQQVGYLDDEITALAWQPQTACLLAGDARGGVACWDV